MFPMFYYIDCNGDMWVPCRCGENGENGVTGGVEIIPPIEIVPPIENFLGNKTRVTKEVIVEGKVIRTEIIEEIDEGAD